MKRSSTKGVPAGLNRSRVIQGAVEVLGAGGVSAVTMRGVARHLGVTPMALYNHVDDRDDLLAGVAGHLIEKARFASSGSWDYRLRTCFAAVRDCCRAERQLASVFESLKSPPALLDRPRRIAIDALSEIGLTGDDALRAYYLLLHFTISHSGYEARMIDQDSVWDFDQAFAFGIDAILAGLEIQRRCS